MNKNIQLFIQAILIGAVTTILGSIIIKVFKPEQEIRPLLLSLFILGFILFYGIELVGGHKKFCSFYNKM